MIIVVLSNLTSYTYNFRYEILQKMVESGHDVVIACHNDDEGKQKSLGTRTRKDLSTCTSSMRVCQFHHPSRWKTGCSIL